MTIKYLIAPLVAAALLLPFAPRANAQAPDVPPAAEQPKPDKPDGANDNNKAPLKNRAPISSAKLRPWAEGVPTAKQEEALALFRQGNEKLRASLFIKAAELYREALKHWDHPAIHYNLALSLITLEQPVAVFKSLERAMAYGPEPLEEENYQRAVNYKTLVSQLVAKVEIKCAVPGAQVSLDGRELFVGPGQWNDLVPIGEHSIVARKDGFLPTNEARRFGPGEDVSINLKLFTVEDVTEYRRRWATWKPYAVLGGGAVIAAVGGIFHVSAASSMTDFNDGIAACGGCVPDAALASKRDSARSKETLAYTSYVVGFSAIAAGAVLAYLNRERPYRAEGAQGVTLVPTISKDSTGVAAIVNF